MSLETELHKLTEALLTLASAMVASSNSTPVVTLTPVAATTPVPAPATPAPAPVTPAPVAATPALPAAPAAPVLGAAVPFTDAKGLVDWVMTKYKELGPTQGALIQNVLVGLGYQNINEVKPEHYLQLVTEVGTIPAAPATP